MRVAQKCSNSTSISLCLRFFPCIVFGFSIIPCIVFILISYVFGYVTFHILSCTCFFRCFSCLVQLLLPLVSQFSLSLCFSCRSRHTNLANFVIFWSFLLPLFVFRLVSCSPYLIQLVDLRLFQLIASKRANLLDVRISITRRLSVWHMAAYGFKIGPSWLGTQFSVSKSQ